MTRHNIPAGAALLRRLCRTAAVALVPLALSACGDLFDVDNPVDILEEELDDPRILPALTNSAEGAVSRAYDIAVQYGELPGDAVIHISTNQGNLALDRGILGEFNERAEALYNELAAARWTATEATRRLEALVTNPTSDAAVGRAYFWDAIARITLADLIEEVPFDGGTPQTPAQVYTDAISLLQNAADIFKAANNANYEAASYGTMARAYRSLYYENNGDMAAFEEAQEAAARSLQIKSDFRVDVGYQTPGSANGLYGAWLVGTQYDVMDPLYAKLADPVSGQREPRIKHGTFSGIVSTFGDSVYQQLKYGSRDADIRVSSWQESRLILAEYHLLNGNLAEAATHINAVRAAAELPAYTPASAAEAKQQLVYERKVEFWLELRRWQDMRYYDIIPDRWLPAMKQAGVDRRFPVSLRERLSNPNYGG